EEHRQQHSRLQTRVPAERAALGGHRSIIADPKPLPTHTRPRTGPPEFEESGLKFRCPAAEERPADALVDDTHPPEMRADRSLIPGLRAAAPLVAPLARSVLV